MEVRMFMVKIKEELLSIEPYAPGKPIEEVKREMGLKRAFKFASNHFCPLEK